MERCYELPRLVDLEQSEPCLHVAEERAEDSNRRSYVPESARELALLHDHGTLTPLFLAHDVLA